VKKFDLKIRDTLSGDLPGLNDKLGKLGLPPIKVTTRSDFAREK